MKAQYIALPLACVLLTSPGCVGISREEYMKVKAPSVKRSTDLSLSQLNHGTALPGYKNMAIFRKDGVVVEFRSDPHYRKPSYFGLILPIIPTGLFGATKGFKTDRLMYITNTGSNGVVHITDGGDAANIMVRVPRPGNLQAREPLTTLLESQPEALELRPADELKIICPETKRSELHLQINEKDYVIQFKEDTGHIWHKVGI